MPNKRPIAWHEECLAHQLINLQDIRVHIARRTEEADALQRRAEHYAEQIKEAKARGLDGFDRDLFLRKQKSRVVTG